MKLRYYLRGVGVGLILAVAVYSTIIIPRKYKMTDEEVLARARELGMVEEENMDVDLSALSGTPAPPEETGTPAPTGDGTPTPPKGNGTPTPSGEEDPTPTPQKLSELTPSIPPEKEANSTPVIPGASDTPAPTVSDTPGIPSMPTMPDSPTMPEMPTLPPESLPQETGTDGEKISITIPQGMGSESFALELQKAGLVEDAVDFDRYLMQNNYALYIRPGTYRILPGATYEEIARQVTAN